MSLIELIILAVALAMDAFAVSICKGLCMRTVNYRHSVIICLVFGFFQALMPTIGWLLGTRFSMYITEFDHWIAFALLAFIGGKMLYECFTDEEEQSCRIENVLDVKELIILAVATSIDALAAGITLALFPEMNILFSVSLIGIITFFICFAGVIIGNKFGIKYKSKAEIAGGVVLILLGIKILLEHLGIISL